MMESIKKIVRERERERERRFRFCQIIFESENQSINQSITTRKRNAAK
jgi:hypothetical protein